MHFSPPNLPLTLYQLHLIFLVQTNYYLCLLQIVRRSSSVSKNYLKYLRRGCKILTSLPQFYSKLSSSKFPLTKSHLTTWLRGVMEDRLYSFLGGIEDEETVSTNHNINRMASGLYLDINGSRNFWSCCH